MRQQSDLELLRQGFIQLLWLAAEDIANSRETRRNYLMAIEYPAILMPQLYSDLTDLVVHILNEQTLSERRTAN